MSDVSRDEFNGLGKRVDLVALMTPKVERNEEDIQKIFDAMDKIPSQNEKMMKDVDTSNQKLANRMVFTIVGAFILMAIKEFATK